MAAPYAARRLRVLQRRLYFLLHKRYYAQSNPWKDTSSVAEIEVNLGEQNLKFRTGQLARFADGAAVAELGDTTVLVTAVCQKQSGSQNFLPLTVDFRQKAAAAGRIPTNFLRRELGPTEREILTSRIIDRSVRPLFPPGFCYNTQLVCNLLAVDGINDPDVISINAASAALAVSDIPWNGPVAAVRVGILGEDVVINPTRRQLQNSSLNIVLTATTQRKVVMLEGEGDRVSLHKVEKALSQAVKTTQGIIEKIKALQVAVGKPKREFEPPKEPPQQVVEAIQIFALNHVRDILYNTEHDKISRDQALRALGETVVRNVKDSLPDVDEGVISSCYQAFVKRVLRDMILDEDRRCDGRGLSDLRNISCAVDLFKPLHGSALFQRGQTQVLCTVTFDSLDSAVKSDPISVITGAIKDKNFMLHYEFPPYATNETGKGGIGRREMGHGALAERGLKAILPAESEFTTRLTSEVLESNGSSSMASVCGGSLALMDAGVQVKEPAAGVAIGLVTRTDPATGNITDHKILTDLLGIEDYMGDMDFKMAATKSGLTALQADIKLPGIPFFVVIKALENGFTGVKQILEIMSQTISAPRKTMKPCGPVTEKLVLDHAKQSRLVGIGGYNLRKLKSETDFPLRDATKVLTTSRMSKTKGRVKKPHSSSEKVIIRAPVSPVVVTTGCQSHLDPLVPCHIKVKPKLQEIACVTVTRIDEGSFQIFAPNIDAMGEAKEMIEKILEDQKEPDLEFGSIYTGRIVEMRDIGVMVELHPKLRPILLHNSQLDQRKVSHASSLGMEVGQEITVKYFGRDPSTGNHRISRKVLQSASVPLIRNLTS